MIDIQTYQPEWAEQFEQIKCILAKQLTGYCIGIEHVGSTSVVGQSAKPILDIDIIIPSRQQLSSVITALHTLGYNYRGDLDVEGREAFGRIDDYVPWNSDQRVWMKQHVYVCAQDNQELHRHLTFRNYLRQHPEEVIAYGQLKQQLIKQTEDREQYTLLKTDFVENILAKANVT
ncbi:GrpB family protein [Paenibacillus sp. KACC 21273]|uniref:GrpB family protein n=1 Tax=Paenibacillus sp. KACC 21273 TaxID=3025665 RepID=UPI0023668823|nr:GrpB family protein [Paenibacillus sp. KACC 21273]WDF50222.1 GrpB family protein [Paenibacillus sp. KACC 21273]